MSIIKIDGVTKRFGDVTAVDGLSLSVEAGIIYGFLGPNGAGKTTTIDMMLDFVRPTEGSISIFGYHPREDIKEVRQRTGVLPEGFGVYPRLTGERHVEFVMESKGIEGDPLDYLERTGVAHAADRKAGGYSTGMKQRLGLAMALVGEPDLMILDEPSSGLDPNGAREMQQIIREERDRGATIFFSSHIMGQVEAVCERVAILREGKLVAEDTIQGLRDTVGGGGRIIISTDDSKAAAQAASTVDAVGQVETADGQIRVTLGEAKKLDILQAIDEAGVELHDFRTEEASMDEVFKSYTQEVAEA